MKKVIIYLVLIVSVTCYGQNADRSAAKNERAERITLFSDRTFFAAGEKILFAASVQTENVFSDDTSRVLNCELITPEGVQIAGGKFLIDDFSASGYLEIPADISTGYYFLRGYTKYMRNNGPLSYDYISIRVINPASEEVRIPSSGVLNNETTVLNNSLDQVASGFILRTGKEKYNSSDTISILISEAESTSKEYKHITLSAVRTFSSSPDEVLIAASGSTVTSSYFYPETRGITITGKLTDNLNGGVLTQSPVNLSIMGKGGDFMPVLTDSAGRFYFSLPDYTGSRDLFLSAGSVRSSDPKLLVDNDFCTIPLYIETKAFTLTDEEREAALDIVVNAQLSNYFNTDTTKVADTENIGLKAFYGAPDEILYLDRYVQLPTLEEYCNELPTLVKVRKEQDRKYFKILGPQTELSEYQPLVLVDQVAIDDVSKVLAIQPSNISRIEIINQLYLKGDMIYGGIVNIISKKGDFAGIDLPGSGIFINYRFLSEPMAEELRIYPASIPDTRNTPLWLPDVKLRSNSVNTFSFTAPDTPGHYSVVLSGIDSDGRRFRQSVTFDIYAGK